MKKVFNLFLILIALSITFTSSCTKEAEEEVPVVLPVPVLTTTAISEITSGSAKSGGDISSDGGSAIISRGVCWSKSEDPTIADDKTVDGTGTGSFTSQILGMDPNATYYVRAYATTSNGTGYGDQVNLKTTSRSNIMLTAIVDNNYGFIATSMLVQGSGNQIVITGMIGTKSLSLWLPKDFTVGTHPVTLLGDYMIQYSPGVGDIYTSASGFIKVIINNPLTGEIEAEFECTAEGTGPDVEIKMGTVIAYQ